VDIDAFCQTDADQAELMYATAAEWLVDVDNCDGVFVDAYAGTGGFSKALLDRGAVHIIAVERAGSSASALAALAVEPMLVPMEEALPLLRQRGRLAGVVVDPPKKGLAELAKPLAWLDVPRVVLVSCDPDAMARDVRVLVDQGFAIVRVQPIDLYGGTPEIEVLTLLQRAPRSPR
jgi:tRNA/tmRNA/rRNA uracil-C5-methylase (TrmA/RlmC/RlmD family)